MDETQQTMMVNDAETSRLLAVDCGLKTGFALFDLSGRLLWYRSQNFGNRTRLRKAVGPLLGAIDGLSHLVLEGGGDLADVWIREAQRRGLTICQVQAEGWRRALLLPRQQRSGKQAKQVAGEVAREIIASSGTPRPTSLRHDAAEAILVGWWFFQDKGAPG
jgi:hypothetical protein